MAELNQNQAHQIWLQTVEMVKDRVIAPTLYQALEQGVGITLEGDEFILGFRSADLPLSSHLRSSQYKAIIEKCLSALLRKQVRLKIIEGTTIADYENYKRMLAAREATTSSINQRREMERRIEQAWEEVGEKITRTYARLHLRQLAQNKARFIKTAFEMINEAVNNMGYDENSDEIHHRSLARVFEKFATVTEVPSTMLAYEFFKLREEGKLK